MSAEKVLWADPSSRVSVKLAIAGDFLAPRAAAAEDDGFWAAKARGLKDALQGVDLTFLNLEAPLGVSSLPPRKKPGLGVSLVGPVAACSYLRSIDATVVGLANNHAYDFGRLGVRRTEEVLRRNGIAAIGAEATRSSTPACHVWEKEGVRVGLWAAANATLDRAGLRRPGVEPATRSRGEQALVELRSGGAECCIALLHAGIEGTNSPDPADVHLMRGLALSGFDIVAACHSHRVSGWEAVSRPDGAAHCFYGLGSIASDVQYTELEREGLIVVAGITAEGALASVAVHPVELDPEGWGRAGAGDGTIIGRFDIASERIASGAYRAAFYSDASRGFLGRQVRDTRIALSQGGWRGLLGKLRRLRWRHIRAAIGQLRLARSSTTRGDQR